MPGVPPFGFNIDTCITQNDRNFCEGHIMEPQLQIALQTMDNKKSPGLDGLSTNFYKHFWPILTHVYNYAFDHGKLLLTQRRGVISLLFKKGDRSQLQNWRPIMLLNTDYKILTKAIANRLKQTLPFLLPTDQIACIPECTINDNLRLMQDAITYANGTSTPPALISIDQLKAFDRVSHEFLFHTLEKFRLPTMDPSIIHRCGQFGESKWLAHRFYTPKTWSKTGLCFINAPLCPYSRTPSDTHPCLSKHQGTAAPSLTTHHLPMRSS